MTPAHRLQIRFLALLGWLFVFGAPVAAAGAYTTWRATGLGDVRTQVVAGAVALVVVLVGSMFVKQAAAEGPGRAAIVFIVAGAVQMCVSVAAIIWVVKTFELHAISALLWLLLFYLAMFAGEVMWLARALRHDARRVARGDYLPADRPKWNE